MGALADLDVRGEHLAVQGGVLRGRACDAAVHYGLAGVQGRARAAREHPGTLPMTGTIDGHAFAFQLVSNGE